MQERPVDQYTVREMFTEAERLARELSDHLEKGFVPKVGALARIVRPPKAGEESPLIEDGVVRTHSAQVLESDQFTEKLYDRLHSFCEAVEKNMDRIISGG
ncbi:MAG: hypothetical protein IT428_27305 [Planctomycetaceae bacterium]|nr:hypothetical protein [Planctomycetaceae bacterium]